MEKVVFEKYGKRPHYMAAAEDYIAEKLANTLKSVDTNKLYQHEPLDDWRYLLLAKAALAAVQGIVYSR